MSLCQTSCIIYVHLVICGLLWPVTSVSQLAGKVPLTILRSSIDVAVQHRFCCETCFCCFRAIHLAEFSEQVFPIISFCQTCPIFLLCQWMLHSKKYKFYLHNVFHTKVGWSISFSFSSVMKYFCRCSELLIWGITVLTKYKRNSTELSSWGLGGYTLVHGPVILVLCHPRILSQAHETMI